MNIKNTKRKIEDTYQREIERKPFNNVVLSMIISFILTIITFIFAIRPTLLSVTKNIKYKSELNKISSLMEEKINKTREGKEQIDQVLNKVMLLDKALPNESNFQEFLDETIKTLTQSGFVLLRVDKRDEALATLKIEGSLDNLSALINNLENNMYRFVEIENVKTQDQEDKDTDLVEIKLRTFSMRE